MLVWLALLCGVAGGQSYEEVVERAPAAFLRHRFSAALIHRRNVLARRHIPDDGDMSHDDAMDEMGEKSINDLQPDYVFDDDFVSDGENKYKTLHKAHIKAEGLQHDLEEARHEQEVEAEELANAEKEHDNLASQVAQKEAALHDAQVAVNETGTKDEEMELSAAKDQLAHSKEAAEKARAEVADSQKTLEEAEEHLSQLEDTAKELRAKHGERFKIAEEARVQFAPVKVLNDQAKHVDDELAKVAKIATKLEKEKGDVNKQLDGMQSEKQELDSAEKALQEVADEIVKVDAQIVAWKEKIDSAHSKEDAAKKELPEDMAAAQDADHAARVAKQQLEHAVEEYSEEDYQDATQKEKEVDQELDAVKADLEQSDDTVEKKEEGAKEAAKAVEKKEDSVKEAMDELKEAQKAVTTAAPEPENVEVAWNDPSTWISR